MSTLDNELDRLLNGDGTPDISQPELTFGEDGMPSHYDANLYINWHNEEPVVDVYPYDPQRGVNHWTSAVTFTPNLPDDYEWEGRDDVDPHDGIWYGELDTPDWLLTQIKERVAAE